VIPAVMLEGVEDTLVAGCTFTRLDSNALFLSGYSRRAVIANNTFTWLGQNAIASWGKAAYNDGTNGDQPRGTVVSGNWATEVGIIQKQSSMYFQAETAQATIVDNICFNIPRAAVNFNVSSIRRTPDQCLYDRLALAVLSAILLTEKRLCRMASVEERRWRATSSSTPAGRAPITVS
jgi:hypothetical protein